MDDDPRSPLRVQLELDLDHEPVSGLLRPERGADQTFVGWLGFVDALKRLQDDRREQR
jgi:predicted nucleotidyltransferase